SISFISAAPPEISPPSQIVMTDGSGVATGVFTATAGGFYPGAVQAVLDPTPTAPGSGDELTLSFDVAANDVIALSKPVDSGDGQVAPPNQPFEQPLAVELTRN